MKTTGALAAMGLLGCAAPTKKGTPTPVATPTATPQKGIPSGPIKIGVLTFTSGPGAVLAIHGLNAIKLFVEDINSKGGILGRRVELIVRPEGKAEETVREHRRLAEEDKVDYITGLISSGNGKAVAPVAEELGVPTCYWCATTTELFEVVDTKPKFVFRAGNYDIMETTAGAVLTTKYWPEAKTLAGINPDYAYGRDEWKMYTAAIKKLNPDIEIVAELWPPLFTTDYTAHISKLLAAKPDVIMSSLWGGDLVTFLKQASAQGLFKKSKFCSTIGGTAIPELDKSFVPEGLLVGLRSWFFEYPPADKWPIAGEFLKKYLDTYKVYPTYEPEHAYFSIYAFKAAVEKAYAIKGSWPDNEEIVTAMENIGLPTLAGFRYFREDHQGIGAAHYGITKHSPKYPFVTYEPVEVIAPPYVSPPPGIKCMDWIASWK